MCSIMWEEFMLIETIGINSFNMSKKKNLQFMTDQRILCWLSETKEDSCETLLIFLLSVKELTFMCNELLIPITSQRLWILKGQATVTLCIHVWESMPFKPKSSIGNENNKSIFQYHDLLGWWFNLKNQNSNYTSMKSFNSQFTFILLRCKSFPSTWKNLWSY